MKHLKNIAIGMVCAVAILAPVHSIDLRAQLDAADAALADCYLQNVEMYRMLADCCDPYEALTDSLTSEE